MIKLYTSNTCPKCVFIKGRLKDTGVDHEIINVDEVPEAREALKEKGLSKLPIMEYDGAFILEPAEMNAIIEDETA